MFAISGWHRRWHLPKLGAALALCAISGCVLGLAVLKPFRVVEAPEFHGPAAVAPVEPAKASRFQGRVELGETGTGAVGRW